MGSNISQPSKVNQASVHVHHQKKISPGFKNRVFKTPVIPASYRMLAQQRSAAAISLIPARKSAPATINCDKTRSSKKREASKNLGSRPKLSKKILPSASSASSSTTPTNPSPYIIPGSDYVILNPAFNFTPPSIDGSLRLSFVFGSNSPNETVYLFGPQHQSTPITSVKKSESGSECSIGSGRRDSGNDSNSSDSTYLPSKLDAESGSGSESDSEVPGAQDANEKRNEAGGISRSANTPSSMGGEDHLKEAKWKLFYGILTKDLDLVRPLSMQLDLDPNIPPSWEHYGKEHPELGAGWIPELPQLPSLFD